MGAFDEAKDNLSEGLDKAKDAAEDAAEFVKEKSGEAADFIIGKLHGDDDEPTPPPA